MPGLAVRGAGSVPGVSGAEILDVDLLAFERGDRAGRAAVVDGVMRSLRTGFVYVAHDLPADLLDRAYECLEAFFSLPAERKARYTVAGASGQTGYTGLAVETAASSDVPDWKEMLNWSDPRPAGHPLRERHPFRYGPPRLPDDDLPGAGELLLAFHRRVAELQRRVLRIIGAGLGVHEDYFDRMVADGATMTRAIHYPAMDLAPGAEYVWAGDHCDINLITALPRATAAGLQVRTAGGWTDAVPPDGGAIVNTGIMLEHLTNGAIPAGRHRVAAPPGQTGDRYSVVQFAHPAPWFMLAPLPTCVTGDNPLRYPTVSADDALAQVLWEINLKETGRRIQ